MRLSPSLLRMLGMVVTPIGVVLIVLGLQEIIPITIGAPVGFVTTLIGAVFLVYPLLVKTQKTEEFEGLLPYIVLFLKISLLAGMTPKDALKVVAETTGSTTLTRLLRYIMLTGDVEAAVKTVAVGDKRLQDIVRNIFRAINYGESSIKYLDDLYQVLIGEREAAVNKLTTLISMLTTIYTSVGVFGPIFIIILVMMLSVMGAMLVNPLLLIFSLIIIAPAISLLFALFARKSLAKILA